ncbi:MAG: hypothetical protein ACKO6N_13510 [Myxococcota bacterium]
MKEPKTSAGPTFAFTRWSWGLVGVILTLWAVHPFWSDFSRVRLPEPNDDWDNQLTLAAVQRALVWEQHSLPLWNRYPEGGVPLLANPESSILYPLTWLVLPFHPEVGLRLLVVLHALLAVGSMAVFLRALRLSPPAVAYGALCFLTASLFADRMQVGHLMWMGMAWMPWVLLAGVESSPRAIRLAGLALAMQWLLGAHYLVIFSGVGLVVLRLSGAFSASSVGAALLSGAGAVLISPRLAAPYSALVALLPVVVLAVMQPRVLLRELGRLLPVGLWAAGLGAVKLLPTYELLVRSTRFRLAELEPAAALGLLEALGRQAGLLARDPIAPHEDQFTFWHPLPWLLALVGLWRAGRSLRGVSLLLGVGLLWSLGHQSPLDLHYVLQQLPGLSWVRYPARASLLVLFAVSVLAALALHMLEERLARVRVRGLVWGVWLLGFFSAFWMARQSADRYGGLFVEGERLEAQAEQPFERRQCPGSLYAGFLAGQGCINGFSAVPLLNARNVHAREQAEYRGEVWLEPEVGVVRILQNGMQALEVEREGSGKVRVMFNQSYYPGWQVELLPGGAPGVQLGRVEAERGLMSVTLESGPARLHLYYRSEWARWGALVSLVTLLCGGLVLLRSRPKISIDTGS